MPKMDVALKTEDGCKLEVYKGLRIQIMCISSFQFYQNPIHLYLE